MISTRTRFIGVAVLVCFFAVGMATFLNFYKYKSTFGRIVQSRLLVIGYGIENSVESSLGLGMSFTALGMLPSLLEREKAADRLITGIDVFGPDGGILYSTDTARVGTKVPEQWLVPATTAKGKEWTGADPHEMVAGIALKNSFDLTVGYLALRYTREYVERSVFRVGRELLVIGLITFVAASVLASLILIVVLRRYERDMRAIGARIAGDEVSEPVPAAFAQSVQELRDAIGEAESRIDGARASLDGIHHA